MVKRFARTIKNRNNHRVARESDKTARRSRDRAARPDASLDEALLRQRYADVLNEPIPQRLLQALQGQPDEARIMKKEP